MRIFLLFVLFFHFFCFSFVRLTRPLVRSHACRRPGRRGGASCRVVGIAVRGRLHRGRRGRPCCGARAHATVGPLLSCSERHVGGSSHSQSEKRERNNLYLLYSIYSITVVLLIPV